MVHASRKLPHYFQAHIVVVLTQLPLKYVLRTADYIGKIALWNTILGVFDIKYMPRTSIKGQVLADLVAEFAELPLEILAEQRGVEGKSVGVISTLKPSCWKVYIDGAANQRGSEVGLVLISLERATIEKSVRLGFLGRGSVTCLMSLPNDTATVNMRDTLRHDLWGRGYDPPRGKLPNAEIKLLHPKWQ